MLFQAAAPLSLSPPGFWLERLHNLSDLAIGSSYAVISATLTIFVWRVRRTLPFHWMFLAFGVFIVACGVGHLLHVLVGLRPVTWPILAVVQFITVVASVITALCLPSVVPRASALIASAQRADAYRANLERANADLRRSEDRFRNAFEHAAIGMALVAPDGRFLRVNRALCDLLGYEVEELLACDFQSLTHPDDLAADLTLVRRLIAGEIPFYQLEKRYLHREGREIWALLSVSLVRGEGGRPVHFISQIQDLSAAKAAEERLRHQALHDALTGLPNRTLLNERLEGALSRAARGGGPPAILFLDLDRFKAVNDSLGHGIGDLLLATVAGRLVGCVREADTVARLGGDEFVILLEEVSEANESARVAERVIASLTAPVHLGEQELIVTTSIGIAIGSPDGSASELLRDADTALYRAKAAGRNRFALFDRSMHDAAMTRLEMERDLRRAIECDELALVYQPLVDLADGRTIGVEALVRWNHPTRGPVPPREFIPIAEDSGLIRPLGRWVLRAACRQASQWRARRSEEPGPSVSVNLSAAELRHPELVDEVAAALAGSGLDPARLQLEITESAVMDDAATSQAVLGRLRALGVRLAIDDFGTGYSSLAYLKRLSVDAIKIDRAFVDGLGTEAEDSAIVGAIVTLARTLGLRVMAEGVETAGQLAQLRALGCELGQGYLFAHPLGPGAIEALLRDAAPADAALAAD